MVASQTTPTIDAAEIAQIIEATEKFLLQHDDHKLVQQVTIMRGFWELTSMYPEKAHAYELSLRKSLDDVMDGIQAHLAEMNGCVAGECVKRQRSQRSQLDT